MSKFKDLTGKKFNHFTFIHFVDFRNHSAFWLCRCDCGVEMIMKGSIVTRKDKPQKSCKTCYEKRRLLHGMTGTKEFFAWRGILSRCTCETDEAYSDYGGRGITVCDRWLEFKNFFEDMGYAPTEKHTLDRIENDKGYCKENCRWTTMKVQANNKRNNKRFVYNGENKTISEWADKVGVNTNTLWYRLKRGMPIETALNFSK